MKDVTIVIQGRVRNDFLVKWVKEYSDWNVILSTWNDSNIGGIEFPESWRILMFPKPPRYGGVGNLDYQIDSTLNGLKYVETDYCIKARGDEFFLNLYRFVKDLKLKPEQIICGDVFYRALENNTFFHIGDHLIGGTTENMKIMFENTKRLLKGGFRFPHEFPITHVPEPYLGFGFVQEKEKIDLDKIYHYLTNEISQPLCEKWFDSFHLEKFEEFIITRGAETLSSRYNCSPKF